MARNDHQQEALSECCNEALKTLVGSLLDGAGDQTKATQAQAVKLAVRRGVSADSAERFVAVAWEKEVKAFKERLTKMGVYA